MSKVCSKCNTGNPDSAHYCARCGNPLEKVLGLYNVEYIVVKKSDYNSLVEQRASLRRENQRLQEQVSSSWLTKIKNFYNSDFMENVKIAFSIIVSIAVLIFLIVMVYDSCSKSDTIEIVKENSKYGLYDNKLDKQVQPFVYDSISYQNKNDENYYCLYKDGKIGLADSTGATKLDCVADSIIPVESKLLQIFSGGKQGVADVYANVILPCNFYKVFWNVIPNKWTSFDKIGQYVGNIIPVKETLYSKWELYDRSGKKINDAQYSDIKQTGHSNLVNVSNLYGYYGLVDINGNTVLPLEYISLSVCINNRMWAKHKKVRAQWDCIDENGQKIFSLPRGYSVYYFSDSLSAVINTDGLLGYVNPDGTFSIPAIFKQAKTKTGSYYDPSFYNGKAIVSDGKSNGRIDKNGNFTKDESLN